MDKDFEQTMAILAGGNADNFLQQQLNKDDKKQIDNTIAEIFSGLSLQNWLNGDTLGDAWSRASDSVRDMIFAIPYDNPATTYARISVFEHRKKQHTQSVYSQHINQTLNCSEEQRPSWHAKAADKIKNGQEMLMRKIMEFNSVTVRKPTYVPPRNTNLQKNIQNTREYENEREREK